MQNLKPSVLLILLIISITFLLSISLCLLLRYLNRRFLRNASTSSTISTSAVTHVTATSSNRVSPDVSDPAFSIVDSLPVFVYSSIKRRSAASSGDCAVCLSKFEQEDQLRLLPLCCHAFHVPCIDTWLLSNQTCPLCRSPIHASDADILKALTNTIDGFSGDRDSFRLEIGSISRRQTASDNIGVEPQSSYSFGGSFEYIVDDESEVDMSHTHRRSLSDKEFGPGAQISQLSPEFNLPSEVGAGRSWLKEYVDRLSTSLSSRTLSFRSPGSFFTGSSRRSDIGPIGDYDLEAHRAGEEISEMFRWFSGV